MNIQTVALIFSIGIITGCSSVNITSSSWDTNIDGNNIKTRCETVNMRSNLKMDRVFRRYDGWKLKYISEYATGYDTDGVVCFESESK